MGASPLTLHNFYQPGRPESGLLEDFAARAKALGAGSIEVGHGNAAGRDDTKALDWAGKIDGLSLIWSVFMRAENAEMDASYIMGSVRDIEEHQRALPLLERFQARLLAEAEIVPLAFFPSPILTISVFAKDSPVTSLDALRERKLRVFSKDLEPTFQRLGVDARFIPQGALYDALADGTFDATVYPACHTAWSVPLWRVTQHASYLFPEALPPYVLACPKALWADLGQDRQRALSEAARQVWPVFLRLSVDTTDEMAARHNLTAAGLIWHPAFSSQDRWAFTQSAQQTWAKMAEAASKRTHQLQQDIVEAMAR